MNEENRDNRIRNSEKRPGNSMENQGNSTENRDKNKKIGTGASYCDMIGMAHHVSKKRPHMSVSDRAAQFAPFAALTGYEDEIRETARLTESRILLDETQKEEISRTLLRLLEHQGNMPEVTITYFRPDARKQGGDYRTVSGRLKKIGRDQQYVLLQDGTEIPFADLLYVEEKKRP